MGHGGLSTTEERCFQHPFSGLDTGLGHTIGMGKATLSTSVSKRSGIHVGSISTLVFRIFRPPLNFDREHSPSYTIPTSTTGGAAGSNFTDGDGTSQKYRLGGGKFSPSRCDGPDMNQRPREMKGREGREDQPDGFMHGKT